MANVRTSKSATLEVTRGHHFKKPWHINAISELMNEPTGLKSGNFFFKCRICHDKEISGLGGHWQSLYFVTMAYTLYFWAWE